MTTQPVRDLASWRQEYADRGLSATTSPPTRSLPSSPGWRRPSIAGLHEPNAMVVSTVGSDGAPVVADGAAEDRRRTRLRLLHQPRVAQGPRADGQTRPARCCSPGTPLERQVRIEGTASVVSRRRGRRLLRHPSARVAARRLGVAAVVSRRQAAMRSTAATPRSRRPLRRRRRGAAPAALVRASWSGRTRWSSGRDGPGRMHDRVLFERLDETALGDLATGTLNVDVTHSVMRTEPVSDTMTDMVEIQEGLEGVVAFDTEIAEPDKEGSALRYRGVDIEELVGRVPFSRVWGLLVDGSYEPGLPPAEPFPIPVHSGDIRVDVQSAIAMIAPAWGMRQLYDIDDDQARDDLARTAVMVLSYVAQAARGIGLPMVPESEINKTTHVTERFMRRWRGEPDPAHVKAVDAYWTSAAEHGMNASTFTARVVASTGADVAASLVGCGRRDVGAAARRRAVAGAGHDQRGREARRRAGLRQGAARQRRAADGLRAPGLPGRGPARPGAPSYRPRARRTAVRGGDRAGEGGAGRAARTPAGPGPGDQRRVLGRDRARLRRGAAAHVHLDVHLRPHGRLVRAHPGAEEDRPADPAVGALLRAPILARPTPSRAGSPTGDSTRTRPAIGPAIRNSCCVLRDLAHSRDSVVARPTVSKGRCSMVDLRIPADLLPADGRFGAGPSKVRPAALEALAATGTSYLGTSHRQAGVRDVVGRVRDGLARPLLAARRLPGRARQRRLHGVLGHRDVLPDPRAQPAPVVR